MIISPALNRAPIIKRNPGQSGPIRHTTDHDRLAIQVRDRACQQVGIDPHLVSFGGNITELVSVRQTIWWRMYVLREGLIPEDSPYSLTDCARATGGHHHTTVIHGIRKRANLLYGFSMDLTPTEIIAAVENLNKTELGEAA